MAGTPDPRVGTDLGPYHIEAVVGRALYDYFRGTAVFIAQ
jgi:hypothetical protein